MRAHTQNRIIVRLEVSERFRFTTRTGLILVDQVRFTPSDFKEERPSCWVSGPAVKKDGTEALFNREDIAYFKDIPYAVLWEAFSMAVTPVLTTNDWIRAMRGHPEVSEKDVRDAVV